jgi:hypothetical protein
MADRNSLRVIGIILSGVTAAVMLLAGAMVHAHVDSGLHNGMQYENAVTTTPQLGH